MYLTKTQQTKDLQTTEEMLKEIIKNKRNFYPSAYGILSAIIRNISNIDHIRKNLTLIKKYEQKYLKNLYE